MIMLFGFITGGLARLAVPGPDPMPFWLTILIGLGGAALGGGVTGLLIGSGSDLDSSEYFWILLASVAVAAGLVAAYRHFVQKRPVYGPDALKFPERGFGVARFREQRQQLEDMARKARFEQAESNLQKLTDLHEAGILTDEEFEQKKAQLEVS